jgi:hypothetical protein
MNIKRSMETLVPPLGLGRDSRKKSFVPSNFLVRLMVLVL